MSRVTRARAPRQGCSFDTYVVPMTSGHTHSHGRRCTFPAMNAVSINSRKRAPYIMGPIGEAQTPGSSRDLREEERGWRNG
jgi:hypothetical protein